MSRMPEDANTTPAESAPVDLSPAEQAGLQKAVDAAVAEASTGRLHKVLFFDEAGTPLGDPAASTQLPENPFTNRMDRLGLQYPPFPLEQMILLAEQHPVHAAALEQKNVDTVGQGWTWEPDADLANPNPGTPPDRADAAAIDGWLQGLAQGEETFHELLLRAWDDKLTCGQGYLELARDVDGKVVQVFQVPAHTVRFHHDGIRIAQIRGARMVWFKRWGAPPDAQGRVQQVDRQYGSIKPVEADGTVAIPQARIANELLVFQKPGRRSSWYGVPEYVSAIGWISLALSVRDDNLMFFSNRREPRWAILLTNLENDPNIENDLRTALAVDLKQPHRNLIIPITGNGKIEFKQLTSDTRDGSYLNLDDRADAKILVAHRVPPERLGMTKVGNLGGDVSISSTRVYKEAVVEPDQAMLKARMNRFIAVEYPKAAGRGPKTTASALAATAGWKWTPVAIDLDEESEDLQKGMDTFKTGMCTLDQARALANMDPLDPTVYGDPNAGGMGGKFYFELFKQGAPSSDPGDDSGFGGGGAAVAKVARDIRAANETSLARIDAAIARLFEG